MPGMGNSLRAAALLAFVVLSILVSLLISSVQQLGSRRCHSSNQPSTVGDELASLRGELIHQLNERRDEIIPLLLHHEDHKHGLQEERRPSPQHDQVLDLDQSLWNEIAHGSSRTHMDEMDCGSLVNMQALEVLGSGYTKLVVKVNLAGGQPVALKLVNEQGIDMEKCVEDFGDPEGCRELVSYKLKKEMVLLQRLQHPNVIKLKGHCAGGRGAERGRVTVILEQGNPLQMIQLLQSPWEDRFRVCLDLVRLLHFLSQSPLGSVALLDFQPRQFVTVAGRLKLTDLDDASAKETSCQTDADCTLQFPHRNFSLPCSAQGVCEGHEMLIVKRSTWKAELRWKRIMNKLVV